MTSTSARPVWMTCHASYESRNGRRQTDVAISTTREMSAAMPNHTSSGAWRALVSVSSSHFAEMAKWARMNASPT